MTQTRSRGALALAVIAIGTLLSGAAVAVASATAEGEFSSFDDWSAPVNLGPTVNSSQEESGPAISDDGRSLYFNRNPNLVGVDEDEDLFVAHRDGPHDAWGEPVPLTTINSPTFHERNAAVSSDGLLLFLSSNRSVDGAGNSVGFGGLDLYYSRRVDRTDDSGWSAPVNLGPNVNSAANDVGPALLEDQGGVAVLYFTSTRRGNADIYRSVLSFGEDGSLAAGPAAFVTELNSASEDARPAIRQDGLEMIFHSRRPPSLGRDLWLSTRATVFDAWSSPIQLATVNSSANDLQPALSDDAELLLFSSNRPYGFGSDDLWMSKREPLVQSGLR